MLYIQQTRRSGNPFLGTRSSASSLVDMTRRYLQRQPLSLSEIVFSSHVCSQTRGFRKNVTQLFFTNTNNKSQAQQKKWDTVCLCVGFFGHGFLLYPSLNASQDMCFSHQIQDQSLVDTSLPSLYRRQRTFIIFNRDMQRDKRDFFLCFKLHVHSLFGRKWITVFWKHKD